ncbi:YsnF/AvaK domain-containing protein [Myxococcus sp. K15C18031901]|uniref:YsnF/AvaK domain-containing protein n=1 Tax=Myxococcus dinghuensis TaxID=2906761 RepID=UPI0020A78507|nr:DUF2382 domain-containing protein [Myxococcus dinghuensis]MCP3100674.1 YsnF/AvaK domain-containing protein [Myxococcus dinghuensis]
MFQRTDINEGMVVRSNDNEKLGKVFAIGDGAFHIERGLFFPKDYRVAFSEVSDIRNGEVILNRGKDALQQVSESERDEGTAVGAAGAGAGRLTAVETERRATVTPLETTETRVTTARVDTPADYRAEPDTLLGTERRTDTRLGSDLRQAAEDMTIPVHREKLQVDKHEKQAGEVRVHKDVVEEEEVIKVPLRHERVRVERRAVTSDRPAVSAAFKEETIVVPLRGEEVEVSKRSVLDEEVVIHKDIVEEERAVSERVRHENVDIRTEGDIDSPRTLNATSDDPDLRRS